MSKILNWIEENKKEIITAEIKAENLIRKFGLLSTEVVKEVIGVVSREKAEDESLYWADVEQHLLSKLELVRPEHEDYVSNVEVPCKRDNIIAKVSEYVYEGLMKGINYDTIVLSKQIYKNLNVRNFITVVGNIVNVKESCSNDNKNYIYDSSKVNTRGIFHLSIISHEKDLIINGWLKEIEL